jgi:hypothetical protein
MLQFHLDIGEIQSRNILTFTIDRISHINGHGDEHRAVSCARSMSSFDYVVQCQSFAFVDEHDHVHCRTRVSRFVIEHFLLLIVNNVRPVDVEIDRTLFE